MRVQGTRGRLWLGWELCWQVTGGREVQWTVRLVHTTLAVFKDGQLIVLLNIKQGAKKLTLKDINDPVQRLLQLVVLLHEALFGPALVPLSLVKFGPVLLEKLQGSLSIFLSHRHVDAHSPPPRG